MTKKTLLIYFYSDYFDSFLNLYTSIKDLGMLDSQNIYSILVGISFGLGYGDNFISVLISHCTKEMINFIKSIAEHLEPFVIETFRKQYISLLKQKSVKYLGLYLDIRYSFINNYLNKLNNSKTLNCGYNKGISVLEVAKAFKKQTSKKVEILVLKRRKGDMAKITANSSKLRKFISNIIKV